MCVYVFNITMNFRCCCWNCSLEGVVKRSERWCFMEVIKCREKMEEAADQGQDCVTLHPGFDTVCLNQWVLHAAAIGLKTKSNKLYTTLLARGQRAEPE